MIDANTQTMQAEVFGEVKQNWGWMLALGILMMILGAIGLGMTYFLTIASVLFFGVLLLVGSGFQLVDAFKSKGWKSVVLHVLMALVYLIAGIVMIADPIGSSVWLTLMIAAMLLVVGIMRVVMALQMRSLKGWGWVAFSGVISILLGVMVFMQWPVSGLWVIGMFVAIEMILQGWSLVMIAFAAKAIANDQSGQTGAPTGAAPA
jgi:uncharacterized membrane protein HdeD (DUF308 family)